MPTGLTNLVAIAAGSHHGLALIGDGPPFLTGPLTDPSPWNQQRFAECVCDNYSRHVSPRGETATEPERRRLGGLARSGPASP